MDVASPVVLDQDGLQRLIDALWADGWTVLGPRVRDGSIGHGEVREVADLPRGMRDEQDAAHYRLDDADDGWLFRYAVGAQSWKSALFPSRELIGRRTADGEDRPAGDTPRLALLGVRSCDLAAIGVHDRVLTSRTSVDTRYVARREGVLVVAVACSDPAATCFCSSMGTGPDPTSGFDIALTELLGQPGHRLLARAGTERGARLLEQVPSSPADDADRAAASDVVEQARQHMGRTLDTADIRDLLYDSAEHPRWDDVAARCLACSSCTMVCPTCFCTAVEDHTDLPTGETSRWRLWDSCFTSEYSYLHGGSVRASTRARYRQWATHKLAAWHDQFGTSGCVGCGRCITWCPAGIDLTEEVAAIRADPTPRPDVDAHAEA